MGGGGHPPIGRNFRPKEPYCRNGPVSERTILIVHEPRHASGPISWLGGRAASLSSDAAKQTGGLAMVAATAVVVAAAAVGGLTMIGRLGDFGWIAYGVVMGVIALTMGPVYVAGMKMRARGSSRRRAEVEERLRIQRVKFGLPSEGPSRPQSKRSRRRSA